MKNLPRRKFFSKVARDAGVVALVSSSSSSARSAEDATEAPLTPIDFRYSPLFWQTAFCFPNDYQKSLIGSRGELRYGHSGQCCEIEDFPEIVEFSMLGMETSHLKRQELEGPGFPIVHTLIERPEAYLELTTFATQREGEGRVDNVILEIRPRTRRLVHAVPVLTLKTNRKLTVQKGEKATVLVLEGHPNPVFVATDARVDTWVLPQSNLGHGWMLQLKVVAASDARPGRYFFRFPQQGQALEAIQPGLAAPFDLLAEARRFWQEWKPFAGEVAWRLPERYESFLVANSRAIQQVREEKKGKLSFQVGSTVYRGLWGLDAHFMLEAARYLGYDAECREGLEDVWRHQQPDGQIVAGGGPHHWKVTAIAMSTLVRQAELGQDWNYFRAMQPNVLKGIEFLESLRARARREGGIMGRYGLLPLGFADGGLGLDLRAELTNTVWTLAGLKAVADSAERLDLSGWEPVARLYYDLRTCFMAAAKQEMRTHPDGFEYLPMLAKDDPMWSAAEEWDRPNPQTAQWALAHSIFPGLVFEKEHPVVKGYVSLMQSCTQEDVPAETAWLNHGGLWTCDAVFAAHVYLWTGLKDWARMAFHGFLNHSSPLYSWREEQPLQGSLTARYSGDMPHATSDAECIRYLRHTLALEDGPSLRLLAGIGHPELAGREPYQLVESPTRFGRLNLKLEPLSDGRGWTLIYRRRSGPVPASVQLPAALTARLKLSGLQGAAHTTQGHKVEVAPDAQSWEARWTV